MDIWRERNLLDGKFGENVWSVSKRMLHPGVSPNDVPLEILQI
jgi:hypothetical protein